MSEMIPAVPTVWSRIIHAWPSFAFTRGFFGALLGRQLPVLTLVRFPDIPDRGWGRCPGTSRHLKETLPNAIRWVYEAPARPFDAIGLP